MKTQTSKVKLTKSRLDKHTSSSDHAVIKMINGKAQLILDSGTDSGFGRKCGFYFITDYNNQCLYISSVGDDIGTENRGFGHVITSINRQRSVQMQELYGLLKNKRTLRVNYLPPIPAFWMTTEFLESPYHKGQNFTESHKSWMRINISKLENDMFCNELRPMKLIMQDIWL